MSESQASEQRDPLTEEERENLEDYLDLGLEHVELGIERVLKDAGPLHHELIEHLYQAGGKRTRPILALICALFGEGGEEFHPRWHSAIDAAMAVELTHLATLYHDDVMDSAARRRGVPAAQIVWGNKRAILAGDILFAKASTIVAGLGAETIAYHAETFERLCRGQLNETYGPGGEDDPVAFYLQVLADKTGSRHVNAGEDVIRAVGEFGERIGVAFQLVDDVIDLTSTGEVSGKVPGTDLVEGVDTMPVLLLRRRQQNGTIDNEGRRILADLAHGDLTTPDTLADVVARLGAHSVVEETREIARAWTQDATRALQPLPNCVAKRALLDFADALVNRMN